MVVAPSMGHVKEVALLSSATFEGRSTGLRCMRLRAKVKQRAPADVRIHMGMRSPSSRRPWRRWFSTIRLICVRNRGWEHVGSAT